MKDQLDRSKNTFSALLHVHKETANFVKSGVIAQPTEVIKAKAQTLAMQRDVASREALLSVLELTIALAERIMENEKFSYVEKKEDVTCSN